MLLMLCGRRDLFCIKLKKLGAMRDWDISVMNDFEIKKVCARFARDSGTYCTVPYITVLYLGIQYIPYCTAQNCTVYRHARGTKIGERSFVMTTNQSHSNSHFAIKYPIL
jgi:hypothetical protein